MRRSRSSSPLRSQPLAKNDVINSLVDSIDTILRYLVSYSSNNLAIGAVFDYVKDRIQELEHFGMDTIYDAGNYAPADTFIQLYTTNKNQQTAIGKEFTIVPMRSNTLVKISNYVELLKNIWNLSNANASPFFERYVKHRITEALGFYGAPVIVNQETAQIITQYNAQQTV